MKAKLFTLCLLLIFACDTVNENKSDDTINTKLKVLLIANKESILTYCDTNWSNMMPNFTFGKYMSNRDSVGIDSLNTDSLRINYDVIVLFEDGVYSSSIYIGNKMYDYVMKGGNLILATFYAQGRSDGGNGSSYGLLESIDPTYHGVDTYSIDTLLLNRNNGTISNHPLIIGMDSLSSKYGGGNDSLRSNATLIARWQHNQILAAFNKPNGRILYLGLFPAELFYNDYPEKNKKQFNEIWSRAIRFTFNETVSSADYNQTLSKISIHSWTNLNKQFSGSDFKKE